MMNEYEKRLTYTSLKHVVPVYFGGIPKLNTSDKPRNGTGGLIRINGSYFVFTCHHVIEAFQEFKVNNESVVFQIGNLVVDIDKLSIQENRSLDVSVIKMSEELASLLLELEPGVSFFETHIWPPRVVTDNDIIHYSGFPGIWQNKLSINELEFQSLSCGAGIIISNSEYYIYTELAKEHQKIDMNFTNELGGMSGAPVFRWMNFGKDETYDFIGIVSEYQKNIDKLLIKKIHTVNSFGEIEKLDY